MSRRLHWRDERICDHSGKDSNSLMLKNYLENNHKQVSFEDFRIFEMVTLITKLNEKYQKRCL